MILIFKRRKYTLFTNNVDNYNSFINIIKALKFDSNSLTPEISLHEEIDDSSHQNGNANSNINFNFNFNFKTNLNLDLDYDQYLKKKLYLSNINSIENNQNESISINKNKNKIDNLSKTTNFEKEIFKTSDNQNNFNLSRSNSREELKQNLSEYSKNRIRKNLIENEIKTQKKSKLYIQDIERELNPSEKPNEIQIYKRKFSNYNGMTRPLKLQIKTNNFFDKTYDNNTYTFPTAIVQSNQTTKYKNGHYSFDVGGHLFVENILKRKNIKESSLNQKIILKDAARKIVQINRKKIVRRVEVNKAMLETVTSKNNNSKSIKYNPKEKLKQKDNSISETPQLSILIDSKNENSEITKKGIKNNNIDKYFPLTTDLGEIISKKEALHNYENCSTKFSSYLEKTNKKNFTYINKSQNKNKTTMIFDYNPEDKNEKSFNSSSNPFLSNINNKATIFSKIFPKSNLLSKNAHQSKSNSSLNMTLTLKNKIKTKIFLNNFKNSLVKDDSKQETENPDPSKFMDLESTNK